VKVRQLIEQLKALPDALDRDVVVEHGDDCEDVNVYRVRVKDDGTVLIDTTIGDGPA